jgi:hypothetical protein
MSGRTTVEQVGLSFMDLICCGLGGMLIMMLIFAALIGRRAAGASSSAAVARGARVALQLDCPGIKALEVEDSDGPVTILAGPAGKSILIADGPPAGRASYRVRAGMPVRCTAQIVGPVSPRTSEVDLPARVTLQTRFVRGEVATETRIKSER